jgi:hypothetical protein
MSGGVAGVIGVLLALTGIADSQRKKADRATWIAESRKEIAQKAILSLVEPARRLMLDAKRLPGPAKG